MTVSRTRRAWSLYFCLVRLEQRDVAAHQFVGRVHIAEDLRTRGFAGLLAAVDVDQRALLLALVAVEDAQRNAHADAESLYAIRIVIRGVVRIPRAVSRIGRTVGDSQLVVGLGLLDRLQRGLQVGPSMPAPISIVVQRLQGIVEIERARHVELIHRRAVVQHLQQLNFGGAQVDDRCFDLRLVLHAQQFDAVQIDLRDIAGSEAVAADLDDLS